MEFTTLMSIGGKIIVSPKQIADLLKLSEKLDITIESGENDEDKFILTMLKLN